MRDWLAWIAYAADTPLHKGWCVWTAHIYIELLGSIIPGTVENMGSPMRSNNVCQVCIVGWLYKSAFIYEECSTAASAAAVWYQGQGSTTAGIVDDFSRFLWRRTCIRCKMMHNPAYFHLQSTYHIPAGYLFTKISLNLTLCSFCRATLQAETSLVMWQMLDNVIRRMLRQFP